MRYFIFTPTPKSHGREHVNERNSSARVNESRMRKSMVWGFIISIAVILSGIAFGFNYFFIVRESFSDRKPSKEYMQDAEEKSALPSVSSPPTAGSAHRIVEEQELTISTVTYSQGKFSPSSLHIKSEAANDSCFLTIVNTSDRPLTIRLSPHDPKDEWGFFYPVIPPGKKSIIDPRYRIPEIVFHNHEKPYEEFEVTLAQGCL